MSRVRQKKHPREFKLEAVRTLRSGKHSASELARRLGVSESHLRDWNQEYEKHKDAAFPGQGRRRSVTGKGGEIVRLKRELEQVTEERDILKKAMAFFARESR